MIVMSSLEYYSALPTSTWNGQFQPLTANPFKPSLNLPLELSFVADSNSMTVMEVLWHLKVITFQAFNNTSFLTHRCQTTIFQIHWSKSIRATLYTDTCDWGQDSGQAVKSQKYGQVKTKFSRSRFRVKKRFNWQHQEYVMLKQRSVQPHYAQLDYLKVNQWEHFLAILATKIATVTSHARCHLVMVPTIVDDVFLWTINGWFIFSNFGLLSDHAHANLLFDGSTVTMGCCTLLCFSVKYSCPLQNTYKSFHSEKREGVYSSCL